jgi:hypothetical protein
LDVHYPVTWFGLTSNIACSNAGAYLTTAGTQNVKLPIYDTSFSSTLAYLLSGYQTIPTSNMATVILQFVNASDGTAVSGVFASNFGGQTPYYDYASNAFQPSLGTGTRGTLVFVGVDPTAYSGAQVQFWVGTNGAAQLTPSLWLSPNCVTYLTIYLA